MAKASTVERGYGADHKRVKANWVDVLKREGVVECHAIRCLEAERDIYDGETWDLGHTPDRKGWTGPEHPKCNRSEGATRGNANRGGGGSDGEKNSPHDVGSSRVDLQACKLEYSIVSPK